MATLPGQRASFTWALNQYNLAEDSERKSHCARLMAKVIAAAPSNGFTLEQVTQGQLYPEAEIGPFLQSTELENEPSLTEEQAIKVVAESVDVSDVLRIGDGPGIVYAYTYGCTPDRLKIGLTAGGAVERIAAQISTSTPDKPRLVLEIRTHNCTSLERAIQAVLDYRGSRIVGGGKEWYVTTRDEVVAIFESIVVRK
jgi:hypothetical protein